MKEAVIAQLEALLQQEDIRAVKAEIGSIKRAFSEARTQWRKEQAEAYKAEHENMDDFVMPEDPLDEQFSALITRFNERMDAHRRQKEDEQSSKLQQRTDLVEALKNLVENIPDNIGHAFEAFKAIQEKWKSIGRVSGEKDKESQSAYNYQADLFHHNMTIRKQLRDLDLERNLEVKQALVVRVQELADEPSIRKMDEEMKKNSAGMERSGSGSFWQKR